MGEGIRKALEAFADYGNWVSATDPMGGAVSGWCGEPEPWKLARRALDSLAARARETPQGCNTDIYGGIVTTGSLGDAAPPRETETEKSVCSNPADCCRELSRVWEALGSPTYDGRSCHEHVAALKAAREHAGWQQEKYED